MMTQFWEVITGPKWADVPETCSTNTKNTKIRIGMTLK